MPEFSYFVVIAGMRTGSNLLQESLNNLADVHCYGELFNPAFVGGPNQDGAFGYDVTRREQDPLGLINQVIQAPGLNGFRLFDGHDQRVLKHVLSDPACAKIVLTRNPADRFVSLRIAQATDQWKLTKASARKQQKVRFYPPEFKRFVADQAAFLDTVSQTLLRAGQTALRIRYSDLQDIDKFNGIARFLGVDPVQSLSVSLKRQNPQPLLDKLTNPVEARRYFETFDPATLEQGAQTTVQHGPGVPEYVTAGEHLYIPTHGPYDVTVNSWLLGLGDLKTGHTQSGLTQWKKEHPDHRSVAVVCHPVERAFSAYEMLDATPDIQDRLHVQHGVQNFTGFLTFLKAAVSGETSINPLKSWLPQWLLLRDISAYAPPDRILRAFELPDYFTNIQMRNTGNLSAIYSKDIEKATRAVYRRDYIMFGFGDWR